MLMTIENEDKTFTLTFDKGVVEVRQLPEGLVCDIKDLKGERVIGTWASFDEISNGKITVDS